MTQKPEAAFLKDCGSRYVSSRAQRKDRAKKAGNYPGSFIQSTDYSWRRKEELEGGDTPLPHG